MSERSRPDSQRRSRTAVAAAWLLLAAALAVSLGRAGDLAAGGRALTGEGERRWFGWAYRDPTVAGRLAEVEALLAPGEAVALVVPPGPGEPLGEPRWELLWLRVMARYYLPGHRLAAAVHAGHEASDAVPPAAAATAEPVAWVAIDDAGARRLAAAPAP